MTKNDIIGETCPCCGEPRRKHAKYCDECGGISKLILQREKNRATWKIMILGYDVEQKKYIKYLFKEVKKEYKKQHKKTIFNPDILEKALNVYLDFLQGEIE